MKRLFTFCAWPLLALPPALTFVGALMNQLAMAFNSGLMPVFYSECVQGTVGPIIDADHSCMTAATHLKVLCDWLNFHTAILSLGDLLLYLSDYIQAPLFWMWFSYALYCMVKVKSAPTRDPKWFE